MNEQTADDESIEVRGPGGWTAKAKGERTPLWMLVVVCIAGLAVAGWMHHDKGHDDHQKVNERFDEVIYMLSLTQEERARLSINMPDSLRQKLRRKREE